jgi:hypothetical protein
VIPKEFLELNLGQVLALHDPRCPRNKPVSLSRLFRALRRMDAQIRANDAKRSAEQREWLAQQFDAVTVE